MTETTVESIFGTKAGIIWEFLNQNGPSNISDLVKATSLSREEVYGALGWLGRENKIVAERLGRAMVFSLLESEIRREAVKGTTMEDTASQKQTRHYARVPPKKTKTSQGQGSSFNSRNRKEGIGLHPFRVRSKARTNANASIERSWHGQ